MSIDEPFYGSNDDDRTVMLPRPGGRRHQDASPTPARPPTPTPSSPPSHGYLASAAGASAGLNPLVSAANVLLLTAGQLRDTTSHPDPDMLRNLIARELTNFENSARQQGVTPEAQFTARYLLCTFMDEIVLTTPWGSQSDWSQQTLLSKFHNEVGGGEKFFQILDKLLEAPASNIELLELIYLCFALGFKGKYRVQAGGISQVEDIQHQLMNVLRQHRGDIERELSPHWRGVEDKRNALARYIPLWVVGAIAAAVMLLFWLGFSIKLSGYSDPVMEELQLLGRNIPSVVERSVAVPRQPLAMSRISVSSSFAAEIAQGLLSVDEGSNKISIVVSGHSLFVPARAQLETEKIRLIEKIATVLERIPGPVLVKGHTDSDPISTSLRLKFPSNWDLSQARAATVATILKQNMTSPQRVIAEGLADTKPLVRNDSADNKARNRRVEITLLLASAFSRQ